MKLITYGDLAGQFLVFAGIGILSHLVFGWNSTETLTDVLIGWLGGACTIRAIANECIRSSE